MAFTSSRTRIGAAAAAGFLAGIAVATLLTDRPINAQASALPALFQEGAELVGPLGPVTVKAIHGPWVVVESKMPGMKADQWIYVPAQGGAWAKVEPAANRRTAP